MNLIQLTPQVKRHDLVFQLPDAYMPELKRAENRINELARQEYARIKADFDIKAAELEAEKAMLMEDMATIRDYCATSIELMNEWYYDQIFMRRIAMNLELRQAKAKVTALADEKVAAWQANCEALLAENEGLRAKLGEYEGLVKELKRAKKPERVLSLVMKFGE